MVEVIPARLPDVIVDFCDLAASEHPDYQLGYIKHLSRWHGSRGLGPLPALPTSWNLSINLIIEAFVSAGRWMAQCPVCKTAVIACHHIPYFMCPGCGNSPDGEWSVVQFPNERDVIEAELLEIPGFRTNSPDRNWRPGE
jgi:hypothetical protein